MTQYYSKQRRLVRHTYSVTASADFESLYPPNNIIGPISSSGFVPVRPYFQATSGSYVNNYPSDPRRIFIDVPDYGKIVDVRVWVEFIHDHHYLDGEIGLNRSDDNLSSVTLALRSPNTNFFSGYPFQNNEAFAGKDIAFFPIGGTTFTYPLFDIYRNSYILWDGHTVADTMGVRFFGGGLTAHYRNFNKDFDMRTVFTDSSPYLNPRHLDLLYPNAIDSTPGSATGSQVNSVFKDCRALSGSAPNHLLWERQSYPSTAADDPSLGNHVSWIYDQRIPGGNLPPSGTQDLDPIPPGWLTGPGGSSNEGEFSTTGSQIGRSTMQPVCPLLSNIVVERVYDDPVEDTPSLVDILNQADGGITLPKGGRFPGFRPGLKGTEIHGRWEFLIGNRFRQTFLPVLQPLANAGIWFRQVRLEFLVEEGEEGLFNPQTRMKYRNPGYVSNTKGKRLLHIMSGTAVWDSGINYTYEFSPAAYGRTAGISDDPGTSLDSFSVFSRITGSLSGSLSTDEFVNLQRGFLSNEFGTPYIPISSGSGISPSLDPFSMEESAKSRSLLNTIVNPKLKIQHVSNLRSVLNRTNFFESTAKAAARVFADLSSGSL